MKKLTKKQIILISISIILVFSAIVSAIIISSKDKTEYFTVTFDSQGGTTVKPQSVEKGSTIIEPKDPVKQGFTFIEWQNNGERFDFETPIIADVVLIATYSINEGTEIITVTLDYQNGEPNQTIEIIKGGQFGEPNNPKRQGYEFDDWYLNNNKFDFSTAINENITLTAKWKTVQDISDEKSNKNTNNTTQNKEDDNTSNLTQNNDGSYTGLIFEKKNGTYCVTGIANDVGGEIIIPNTYNGLSVTSIGYRAGGDCVGITSIKIPNSIIAIEESAFDSCHSLTNIERPNSVTHLGGGAFNNCTKLNKIILSSKLTKISDNLFSWCTNLSSVNIPNGVTVIEFNAFVQCKNLTNITLPNALTKIENNAFEATGLTNITIPNSVKKLGYCIFANCKNLQNVTIGNGVTNIPDGTFTGCTKLSNIKYAGTKAQWNAISLGDSWNEDVPATKVICSDGVVRLDGSAEENTTKPSATANTTQPSTTTTETTTKPSTSTTTRPSTTTTTKPHSDVLIINNTRTISNQTINSDVYITSTAVVTFNNVTVNGNIYCYGQLKASDCTATNVYAYAYGSMMSCSAYDGTHGKVSGGITCNNLVIRDTALDYAFNKWGKK